MILGHYPHDHSGEAKSNDRGGPGTRRSSPMHSVTVCDSVCDRERHQDPVSRGLMGHCSKKIGQPRGAN
jgi:hypothetical protein